MKDIKINFKELNVKIILKRILIGLLFIITVYNMIEFTVNKNKNACNVFLDEFIQKNTDKTLDNLSEYNLYFFVTPLDCESCSKYILQKEFIERLKDILQSKEESITINYIVSGDYTEDEKTDYIANIIDSIDNYYIDDNNKVKRFLLENFRTPRTPFLLISDNFGMIRYWQHFKPDNRIYSKEMYLRLLVILNMIL